MENTTVKESRLNIRCDVHARELLDKRLPMHMSAFQSSSFHTR